MTGAGLTGTGLNPAQKKHGGQASVFSCKKINFELYLNHYEKNWY